jgi:catechol 2,3-dioxygenase-like lactoylglutathione lyase family enzyme
MPKLTGSRFVLAVRNLATAKAYYCDVLGFAEETIRAEGWAFLRRDAVALSLGECLDAIPAGQLGDHSYFAYILVDDARTLADEIRSKGADLLGGLIDQPYGMRELIVRTPDGHRIVFAQPLR